MSFAGAAAIRAELKRAATLTTHEIVAEWAKLWEVNPKAGETRWVKADGAPLHRVAKPNAPPRMRNGERKKSESGAGDLKHVHATHNAGLRKGERSGERKSESGGRDDVQSKRSGERKQSESGGGGNTGQGKRSGERKKSESGGGDAKHVHATHNAELRKSDRGGGESAQSTRSGEKRSESGDGVIQHTQSARKLSAGEVEKPPYGEKIGTGERQSGGASVERHKDSFGGEQMKRSGDIKSDAGVHQQTPGTAGKGKKQKKQGAGKAIAQTDAHANSTRRELVSGEGATPAAVVQEAEGKTEEQRKKDKKRKNKENKEKKLEALWRAHMEGLTEPISGGVDRAPGGVEHSAHTESIPGQSRPPNVKKWFKKQRAKTGHIEGTTSTGANEAALATHIIATPHTAPHKPTTPHTPATAHPAAHTSQRTATTASTDPAGQHPVQPPKRKQPRRKRASAEKLPTDAPGTIDRGPAQGKASAARNEGASG